MVMPSNAFPILRLPYIAVQDVIRAMDPFTVIDFSTASSACKSLAKSCCKVTHKYKIYMFIGEDPSFRISGKNVQYEYSMTLDPAENGVCKFENDTDGPTHTILKYSTPETRLQDFMNLFDYVKEILKIKMTVLFYEMGAFPGRNHYIVDWLRAPEFLALEVHGEKIPNEEVQYLLDNTKIAAQLNLDVETMDRKIPLRIPGSPENLIISHGKWCKLEHYLSLTSDIIHISHNSLSPKDLNRFLKKWMKLECHQGLRQLKINIRNSKSFLKIIDDLVFEYPDEEEMVDRHLLHIGKREGVLIKNRIGTTAFLQVKKHFGVYKFVMTMPDLEGGRFYDLRRI